MYASWVDDASWKRADTVFRVVLVKQLGQTGVAKGIPLFTVLQKIKWVFLWKKVKT